jgi:hypothetical protein
MKKLIGLACLMGFLLLPVLAPAQVGVALPEPGGRNAVSFSIKLEPELTTSLAYTHALHRAAGRWQVRVGGRLTVLPLLLGSRNRRVDLIGMAEWRPGGRWGATFSLQPYLAQVHNRAARMRGLGLELRATPSHYGSRWTTGLDLGWQSTLLTHIRHGEATRETFRNRYPGQVEYDGPADGWYGAAAHRFRVGLVGARRLGNHLAMQLAAGSIFSLQQQGVAFGFSHAQVPVYAEALLRVDW